MKRIFFALFILLVALLIGACQLLSQVLAPLIGVTISGTVKLPTGAPSGGTVWVGVSPSAPFQVGDSVGDWTVSEQLTIQPGGTTSYSFTGVKVGSYIAVALDDLNENGQYDEGEPVGVSAKVLSSFSEDKTINITMTVTESGGEPVTGVTLNKSSTTILVGNDETLIATIAPATATDQVVTWSTSNPTRATVSTSGKVTGVAPGNVTITVKTHDGNFTATCVVTVTNVAVDVTGVSLDVSTASVPVGGTQALHAAITPSGATNQNLTWDSDNDGVATVSAGGVVTGVAGGTATISVTTEDGGFQDFCTVTVTVAVTGVNLSQTSATIGLGAQVQLSAFIVPANATNQAVTWTTDNSNVATVDPSGLVTASGSNTGTAHVIVHTVDGNKTKTATITVINSAVAVTGVTLNLANTTILVGGTQNLFATIAPANASNQGVTWTTSNSGVATVVSGLVTGVSAGTATITVHTSDGNHTANCVVTVSASAQSVTGVSIDQSNVTLNVGQTQALSATVAPANATNQNVTWTTSNVNVATVNGTTGFVTATGGGTATITVHTVDGDETDSITVTVLVPVISVSLSQTTLFLNVGASQGLTAFINPSNATNQAVTWASTVGAVASVNASGQVTANGPGQTTITVHTTDGNKTATCIVTVTAPNGAPSTPSPVYPGIGQGGVDPVGLVLQWNASVDPNADPVTYDLYMGIGTLALVAPNLGSASYDTGSVLSYSATYKWQIVAKDNHGATTVGPQWTFGTKAPPAGNQPPVFNYVYPSSSQVLVNEVVNLYGYASDPEFQPLVYSWTIIGGPGGGSITNPSSATNGATFSATIDGVYFVQLQVTDNGGGGVSSYSSFSIVVNPATQGGYGYGIQ